MNINNIIILIFIVIVSVVIINMIMNCKVYENFASDSKIDVGDHSILEKSEESSILHLSRDENNRLLHNSNPFYQSTERKNFHQLNVDFNNTIIPITKSRLFYNPIDSGDNYWRFIEEPLKDRDCSNWFKHQRVQFNRDMLGPGDEPTENFDFEIDIDNKPSTLEDALDRCSSLKDCAHVSDNTDHIVSKDYEFFLNTDRHNFNQHREIAENMGGTLASIENGSENNDVAKMLRDRNIGNAFLGGVRRLDVRNQQRNMDTISHAEYQSGRHWRWLDGADFSYINWGRHEPNEWFPTISENVIIISSNGLWNDFPDSRSTLPAVYKISKNIIRTEFIINKARLTIEQHRTKAQELGYDIASIHSEEENRRIHSLLQENHINTDVFIGGERRWRSPLQRPDATPPVFRSQNFWFNYDETPFNFTNWNNGEPNNHGGEISNSNIGEFYIQMRTSGNWNDVRRNANAPAAYRRNIRPTVDRIPYYYDYTLRNFEEHQREAKRKGMQLASIINIQELTYIKNNWGWISNSENNDMPTSMWIGLSERSSEYAPIGLSNIPARPCYTNIPFYWTDGTIFNGDDDIFNVSRSGRSSYDSNIISDPDIFRSRRDLFIRDGSNFISNYHGILYDGKISLARQEGRYPALYIKQKIPIENKYRLWRRANEIGNVFNLRPPSDSNFAKHNLYSKICKNFTNYMNAAKFDESYPLTIITNADAENNDYMGRLVPDDLNDTNNRSNSIIPPRVDTSDQNFREEIDRIITDNGYEFLRNFNFKIIAYYAILVSKDDSKFSEHKLLSRESLESIINNREISEDQRIFIYNIFKDRIDDLLKNGELLNDIYTGEQTNRSILREKLSRGINRILGNYMSKLKNRLSENLINLYNSII